MMPTEKDVSTKKVYDTPRLTIHGDLDSITLGNDVGEDLDAAFATNATIGSRGSKKPKKPQFS